VNKSYVNSRNVALHGINRTTLRAVDYDLDDFTSLKSTHEHIINSVTCIQKLVVVLNDNNNIMLLFSFSISHSFVS
jgi:hypothetical protein